MTLISLPEMVGMDKGENTLMVNQAIARPDYSGLSFSQVKLADSILRTAEGKVLRCGDKKVILTGDLSSDRRSALKLAGKLR
jgi:hypothetical protein